MIKQINYQNFLTTPFVAVKSWELVGNQNENVLLLELPSESSTDFSLAIDYIDENFGEPIINNECSLALEQQESNVIIYSEGISGSSDNNLNGINKGLLYIQIKNAFYNNYKNPFQIFGLEHIDFPLSKTTRNLSEQFRLFSIPRIIFGEKIVPNSVKLLDNSFDDNVIVYDDGYQNLKAGYNLFSKVQEVRKFSSKTNPQIIIPGTASYNCITYGSIYLTGPLDQYVEFGNNCIFSVSASGAPLPIHYQWWSGSDINSGFAITDGGNFYGSNGPSLSIINVDYSFNNTSYYIKVWNDAGNGITSSIANLYVI